MKLLVLFTFSGHVWPWVHGWRLVEAAVEADLESNWAVVAEAWECRLPLVRKRHEFPAKSWMNIYIYILVLKVFILIMYIFLYVTI